MKEERWGRQEGMERIRAGRRWTDGKLNEKGGKETPTETSKREKETEKQHLAVRPQVLICFSAELSEDTSGVGRITTRRAYQSASTTLMTRERGGLESSNVALQFYSNDGLKNKPSGCNGFETNGNSVELEELSTVTVSSPNILSDHQILSMCSASVNIKGITLKAHIKLRAASFDLVYRCTGCTAAIRVS